MIAEIEAKQQEEGFEALNEELKKLQQKAEALAKAKPKDKAEELSELKEYIVNIKDEISRLNYRADFDGIKEQLTEIATRLDNIKMNLNPQVQKGKEGGNGLLALLILMNMFISIGIIIFAILR